MIVDSVYLSRFTNQAFYFIQAATGIAWSLGLQSKNGSYQFLSWQIIPEWKFYFRDEKTHQPTVFIILVRIPFPFINNLFFAHGQFLFEVLFF